MSKGLTPPAFLNRQPLALYEAARRALAEAKPSREVLKFSVFLPPHRLPLALGARSLAKRHHGSDLSLIALHRTVSYVKCLSCL